MKIDRITPLINLQSVGWVHEAICLAEGWTLYFWYGRRLFLEHYLGYMGHRTGNFEANVSIDSKRWTPRQISQKANKNASGTNMLDSSSTQCCCLCSTIAWSQISTNQCQRRDLSRDCEHKGRQRTDIVGQIDEAKAILQANQICQYGGDNERTAGAPARLQCAGNRRRRVGVSRCWRCQSI